MGDLSWIIIGILVPTLIGVGVGVMSTSPPEFVVAKWCFTAAYLFFTLRLSWWLVMEQPEGADNIRIATAAFVLLGVSGGLWIGAIRWVDNRQRASLSSNDQRTVQQKQETAETKIPFVREIITASQLEGNAIVLTNMPDPGSVRLVVNGVTYFPQTSPSMIVKGHKIFLENIPGDVPLLTIVRDEASKKSVVVEYYRDPSAKDTNQGDESGLHQRIPEPQAQLNRDTARREQRETVDDTLREVLAGDYSGRTVIDEFADLQRQRHHLWMKLKEAAPKDKPTLIRKLEQTIRKQLQMGADLRLFKQDKEQFDKIVKELEDLRDLEKTLKL